MSRPSFSRSDSQLAFLEPPHSHDLTSVSYIAALPPSTMDQLPDDIQQTLWDLQESTSVAYASYLRLQDLLEDRFERLTPAFGGSGRKFSESAFFNYQNHIEAEKNYLLSDALPDWRHKASISKARLRPYHHLPIISSQSGEPVTVQEWWTSLQITVSSWLSQAQSLSVPGFEDTVEEYLAGKYEMAVSDSEESTPHDSPICEDEPFLPRGGSLANLAGCADRFHVANPSTGASTKSFESRKDSGVGMSLD